ncbi:uncharacterized protein FIBRA_01786 [Fibroporia radiculosa]|uniref:Uncharacterized protein n=1 Tax=Fibroporia radiculosa TaxID=599839 RepID=J4H1F3_9APHY|nr:uncharacterized protein FIBRA_01786 [Fibroporia radiculosa]CCL99764.1 predicted protein [Fibroporia radiculosa]
MFGCNQSLLILGTIIFGLKLIAEVIMGSLIFYHLRVVQLPPSYTGCIPFNIQPWAWMFWIPKVIYHTAMFVIILVKLVREMRDANPTPRMMVLLLRDSATYYITITFSGIPTDSYHDILHHELPNAGENAAF